MKKRLRECCWVSLLGLGIYPVPNHLSSSWKWSAKPCSFLKSEIRAFWKRWCWRDPDMSLTGELPIHLSCQNLAFLSSPTVAHLNLLTFEKISYLGIFMSAFNLMIYDWWIYCALNFFADICSFPALTTLLSCIIPFLTLYNAWISKGNWGKRRIFSGYSV